MIEVKDGGVCKGSRGWVATAYTLMRPHPSLTSTAWKFINVTGVPVIDENEGEK
jgi:hypothetical protein